MWCKLTIKYNWHVTDTDVKFNVFFDICFMPKQPRSDSTNVRETVQACP